jgi:hypothetical protein
LRLACIIRPLFGVIGVRLGHIQTRLARGLSARGKQ